MNSGMSSSSDSGSSSAAADVPLNVAISFASRPISFEAFLSRWEYPIVRSSPLSGAPALPSCFATAVSARRCLSLLASAGVAKFPFSKNTNRVTTAIIRIVLFIKNLLLPNKLFLLADFYQTIKDNLFFPAPGNYPTNYVCQIHSRM